MYKISKFFQLHIAELLQKSEMEYNRVKAASPYSLNTQDMTQQRHSWLETNTRNSINDNDNDSVGSSPDMVKVNFVFKGFDLILPSFDIALARTFSRFKDLSQKF